MKKTDLSFISAITSAIQELSEEIGTLKQMSQAAPIWSKPQRFCKISWGIAGIGVYRVIYAPTGITMSIGQGVVCSRKHRHKMIFENDGRPVESPNGSISDSITGQKMYKYDPNIDNWLFSFCIIGNKSVAKKYEGILQKLEEPEFNNLSMGGNN